MKESIKQSWIEALTSGKYKQGYDRLKTKTDKFCVMGVLTDLYISESKGKACWQDSPSGESMFVEGTTSAFSITPIKVMEWAGVENSSVFCEIRIPKSSPLHEKVCLSLGEDPQKDALVSLSSLNDSKKFSFEELAEIIKNSEFFQFSTEDSEK